MLRRPGGWKVNWDITRALILLLNHLLLPKFTETAFWRIPISSSLMVANTLAIRGRGSSSIVTLSES